MGVWRGLLWGCSGEADLQKKRQGVGLMAQAGKEPTVLSGPRATWLPTLCVPSAERT